MNVDFRVANEDEQEMGTGRVGENPIEPHIRNS